MIYCGYSGVGKTSYCRTHPNCVDLDSSNYKKDTNWAEGYVADALYAESYGYDVFISAHKAVIKILLKRNHKFKLIIPSDDKVVWGLRLKLRYKITGELYALRAWKDFQKNFKDDMKFYKSKKLNCVEKIYVNSVRVLTNIENLIPERK